MRAQATEDAERTQLESHELRLLNVISSRRTLRRIAETPLLRALLWACTDQRHEVIVLAAGHTLIPR